jgi:2-(1,2-epoxy-1,2-dihydrophenyl)acetyl-CoA isomerase
LSDALDQEGTTQTFNFTTKDISEAMRAFKEKRTPDFKGW